MKKLSMMLLFLVLGVFLAAGTASAMQFIITDGNSTASIDTKNSDGMYDWTVDRVSHLYQQWFWFRVGDTGPEASIDTLTIGAQGATDTDFDGDNDTLFVQYLGDNFNIELRYSLVGGLDGSNSSDIAEQITINNTGNSSQAFHFFQYSDFDLNGDESDDSAVLVNSNTVRQWDPYLVLSETVATPAPTHWEIGVYPDTVDRLEDGFPTVLNDSDSIYDGDATWAFQWDKIIGAGSSFAISKDKNLAPVPEPATMLLFGVGLCGLAFVGRKKLIRLG